MIFHLFLQNVFAETELNQVERIHQLRVFPDVGNDIIFVVLDAQEINDLIKLAKFFGIASLQLLPIQGPQDFNQGHLW